MLRKSDLDRVERLTNDISAEYLEFNGVLPLGFEGDTIRIATWREQVSAQVIDDLSILFNAVPIFVQCEEVYGRAAIRRVYGESVQTMEDVIAGFDVRVTDVADGELPLDDLRGLANEAPVIRLVNLLLIEALEARASDVHLESHSAGIRVRYRIDGVLIDAPTPPPHMQAAIISRLKIMAELDIAERRLPQDGRIRLRLQDREVDVRVSTLPMLHGESVVLRLLDQQRIQIDLESLGMARDTLHSLERAASRPQGIILATGPTGSGKTSTLYALLQRIRTGSEKILTVEDPVEYQLDGICQVPVQPKIGLSFAAVLRSLLRQDPDVMLVGEIRDYETAEIAIHAALTGHLVLSTVHTNDAPAALTRLVDLGVPEYLVASTVEVVIAQRLVRRICEECAQDVEVSHEMLAALGEDVHLNSHARQGRGCQSCHETGYRGRTGIYELLEVTDELRGGLTRRVGSRELRSLAIRRGMRTLRQDGCRQVAAGFTTPREVLRVTVN